MDNDQQKLRSKADGIRGPFQTRLVILVIIAFSLTLYFPALSVEYGIFDDYTLVAMNAEKNPWDFHLFKSIFERGREIGATVLVLLSYVTKEVSDLVYLRWASFIILLLFLGLLVRFLRKECGLENSWLFIICLLILMLPFTQVAILKSTSIWFINIPLVLASLSYYLFYYMRTQKVNTAASGLKWKKHAALGGSLFLFVFSLFIYQTTSLVVWVFTFALVVFRPMASWVNTRRIFVQDLLFFGTGTCIYYLLDRMVVMPLALNKIKFDQLLAPTIIYKMELAWDPLAKVDLLWYLFLFSAAGPWHVILQNDGAKIFLFISILGLTACIKNWSNTLRRPLSNGFSDDPQNTIRHSIEKILSILILFPLVNIPSLLGAGVYGVAGYRVLGSMMIMVVLLQIWSLRSFKAAFAGIRSKIFLNGIIILWLGLMSIVSFLHVRDAVTKFHHEMNIMRSSFARFDLDRWDRIIIIKSLGSRSFFGRYFQNEFLHGIQYHHNVVPFLWEQFDKKSFYQRNISFRFIYPFQKRSIKIKERDFLIDLNQGDHYEN